MGGGGEWPSVGTRSDTHKFWQARGDGAGSRGLARLGRRRVGPKVRARVVEGDRESAPGNQWPLMFVQL